MQAQDWRDAAAALSSGGAVTVAAVVEHEGSVPGTTGAMALVVRGQLRGTVGGGAAERLVVDLASRPDAAVELVPYRHDAPHHDSICSGRQLFAVVPLGAGDAPELERVADALDAGRHGALALSPVGLAFEPGGIATDHFHRSGDRWLFTTTAGPVDTLTLIGGGHVALAVSRIAVTLGFRVVVLDERSDVPTMSANTWAHERQVVDYGEVARHVPGGDRSWVVIMTHGHTRDADVLRRLAGRPLRYLGMLGSPAKVRQVFAQLERDGVPAVHLASVRAPVGISIGSHTPAEIAVSIAAELVAIRTGADVETR